MLSKTQSKYIRSLTQQKYRKEYNVFIAEGDKIAKEWLKSDKRIQMVVATEDWVQENEGLINKHKEAELLVVEEHQLKAVSTLQTPNNVLLVVHKEDSSATDGMKGWTIAVSQLQDPGNMGTIIRIADWFGVKQVIASPDSVDFYNPKVVQAAMGGHIRVGLVIKDLSEYIKENDTPVYAAVLEGEDIFSLSRTEPGIILIGNESKGLTEELTALATEKVTIPRKGGAESLNAAISTGILTAVLTAR